MKKTNLKQSWLPTFGGGEKKDRNTGKVKKHARFNHAKQRAEFQGRTLSQANKHKNTTVTMTTKKIKRKKKETKLYVILSCWRKSHKMTIGRQGMMCESEPLRLWANRWELVSWCFEQSQPRSLYQGCHCWGNLIPMSSVAYSTAGRAGGTHPHKFVRGQGHASRLLTSVDFTSAIEVSYALQWATEPFNIPSTA